MVGDPGFMLGLCGLSTVPCSLSQQQLEVVRKVIQTKVIQKAGIRTAFLKSKASRNRRVLV